MKYNTDLALESREMAGAGEIDGVEVTESKKNNAKVTSIVIKNKRGEQFLGRPTGTYITVEITPFTSDGELFDGRLDAVGEELKKLLPKEGLVLVAGLGNDQITPDALGPKALDYVFATRHITRELAESIGLSDLRGVATIVPGVLGQTGMETGEIIQGVVEAIKPAAIIVIDALASMSLERLGCTVQISDTGIVPGSGVGNHRFEISEKTMGVPVVSLGIPTVVDGATLVFDLIDKTKTKNIVDLIEPRGEKMIVTPREIDTVIERGAKLIGMSINTCLQKGISAEDLFSLVG